MLVRVGSGLCILLVLLLSAGPLSAGPLNAGGPNTANVAPPPALLASPVVYSQLYNPAGGLIPSSLRDPDGSATDQWAWDGFKLGLPADITEIRWTGGYDPTRGGFGGPVRDFTVKIYPAAVTGTQPDVAHPPLVQYRLGTAAGETPGPVAGTVQLYDYSFTLPAPFHAPAGTKFWLQIEAFQSGISPDWGLAKASNGDGSYFRLLGTEFQYQTVAGDTAFTLLGTRAGNPPLYLPILLR